MVAESEKSHARQSRAVKKPQKTRLGNGELEVRLRRLRSAAPFLLGTRSARWGTLIRITDLAGNLRA